MTGNSANALAKPQLRRAMRSLLASISKDERAKQSAAVTRKLINLPSFQKAQRVAVFLSMPNEIDTRGILQAVFEQGKRCFIPHTTKAAMNMYEVQSLEDIDHLPQGIWGIRQPEDLDAREEAISGGGLDLVVMPGLAFTTDGKRLGQGKAYYDRFLAKLKQESAANGWHMATTVAIAFKEQLLDDVPTEPHDVLLDMVVTGDDEGDATSLSS